MYIGARLLGRISPLFMKAMGWVMLVFLAIIYKAPDQGAGTWMHFHWWGILGLIGWGYLLSALVYLFIGNKPGWLFLILTMLYVLNVNEFVTPFGFSLKIVISASSYALVMGGLLSSAVLIQLQEKNRSTRLIPLLLAFAALLLIFGFLTRPAWGISKIMGTPSWTAICSALTALSFALLYFLSDKLGIYRWADLH